MTPIHDADPLLILAIAIASKRRAAVLPEIVAAIEFLNGALPAAQKLADAFRRLSTAGLVLAEAGNFRLTDAGEALAAGPVGKADAAARLLAVRERLAGFHSAGGKPVVEVELATLEAAIAEHRALAAATRTNALLPKPKPPEEKTRGPGFRQRKPMPAKRKAASARRQRP
jgi:hypothetical protein